MNNIIIIAIITLFIFSYIIIFLLGLLVGRLLSFDGVFKQETPTAKVLSSIKNTSTGQPISIDNSKFVVDIKTDQLEKKYEGLGEIKNSQENIGSSINKLKNMKG